MQAPSGVIARGVLLLLVPVLGCGSPPLPAGDAAADSSSNASATTPSSNCSWPAMYDGQLGATDRRCTARRYQLWCESTSGIVLCINDVPDRCPGQETLVPPATFTCHHRCEPMEYGMICQSGATGPGTQPPAGCKSLGVAPGGAHFLCCPCGG